MDDIEQCEQRMKQHQGLKDLLTVLSILLGIVLIAGGVGWHYFYGPCGVARVNEASQKLSKQAQIYNDAFNIASSTPRIALAGPVADLQRIQRETEDVQVPKCLETAKQELVWSIDAAVKGYLAFMGDESDNKVSNLMSMSTNHFMKLSDELLRIDDCKPFCKEP